MNNVIAIRDRTLCHDTEEEIKFLGALGTYSRVDIPVEELYSRYIKASRLRRRWGNIDKDMVIKHAHRLMTRAVNSRIAANRLR